MDSSLPPAAPGSLRDLDGSVQWHVVGWAVVRIVVLAIVLIGGYFVLPFDRASIAESWVAAAAVVAALIGLNVIQLRAVARSDRPVVRAAEALVVSVLLLLVAFAATYVAMSGRDDAAFNEPLDHVGALYFALTTLTTIGYGDIAPLSDMARIVVMVQMVVNVVVLGVFVRLIVSAARSRLSEVRR